MSPAPGRLQLTALATLAGAGAFLLGSAAGPVAATTPVNPGEITGKVSGKRPAASKGAIVVRAVDAASGAVADVATIGRRGTFTLVVPPGAYAVRATVVQPGRGGADASIPVTVKERQKRAGLKFNVSGSGRIAKAANVEGTRSAVEDGGLPETARRSYVTANGSEVAGVTAVAVQSLKGGSGDWADVRRTLPALLQTELYDSTTCPTVPIANTTERGYLTRSVKFRSGRLVSRGTKVQRNLIVANLAVTGRLEGRGKSAKATFSLTDQRTGVTFETVTGTFTTSKFTSKARKIAASIAERLCRTPAEYQLKLSVDNQSSYATHAAAGRLDATMTANQTGGTGGQPSATWKADGQLAWSQVAFRPSTPGCRIENVVPAAGNWTALLSVVDGQLAVDWGTNPEFYLAFTTGTLYCGATAFPVPGPGFVGVLPNTQRLPLSGGELPVSGDLDVIGQRTSNRGTLTVTPVWSKAPPTS